MASKSATRSAHLPAPNYSLVGRWEVERTGPQACTPLLSPKKRYQSCSPPEVGEKAFRPCQRCVGAPGRPNGKEEGGKGKVGERAGARLDLGARREGGRLVGEGRRGGKVRRVGGEGLVGRAGE